MQTLQLVENLTRTKKDCEDCDDSAVDMEEYENIENPFTNDLNTNLRKFS